MTLEPETYTYKTIDGCAIRCDVYHPPTAGRHSVVVYIHGGCLIYGSRRDIHPEQLRLYREAGHVLVSIDYRLAPETKLPAIIADLQDAFRWVREQGPGLFQADPERVAVVGHSAGGYLALMSGWCVDPHPRAVVSYYGYGDIIGDWYSKPDPFYCEQPRVSETDSGRPLEGPVISEPYEGRGKELFYLYLRQNGLWPLEVGGRDPVADPDFFTPYCPALNVSADYPPTWLLHGDRDTDVPYGQSVQMAEALSQHGVAHRLITMKGYGHGFDYEMHDPLVREAFVRALGFLGERLRA
jgi:acetyl esterase/lipase